VPGNELRYVAMPQLSDRSTEENTRIAARRKSSWDVRMCGVNMSQTVAIVTAFLLLTRTGETYRLGNNDECLVKISFGVQLR